MFLPCKRHIRQPSCMTIMTSLLKQKKKRKENRNPSQKPKEEEREFHNYSAHQEAKKEWVKYKE
jgi:hypothetical protein